MNTENIKIVRRRNGSWQGNEWNMFIIYVDDNGKEIKDFYPTEWLMYLKDKDVE